MQHIIASYGEYNAKHYGTPWGAICDSEGRPAFEVHTAHYTGENGKAGDLFAVDPPEMSVWVYGQRNYQEYDSNKRYVQFREGKFVPVSETELVARLQEGPQIQSAKEIKANKKKPVKGDKKKQYSTWTISVSQREDQILRDRAALAGMTVAAFVKREALQGEITTLDIGPLTEHSLQLGQIAYDIHKLVNSPHPDRWLYQETLEQMIDRLNTIIEIERKMSKELRKRMR